eukprot:13196396-Heterocapsa_arctica.AAC.1
MAGRSRSRQQGHRQQVASSARVHWIMPSPRHSPSRCMPGRSNWIQERDPVNSGGLERVTNFHGPAPPQERTRVQKRLVSLQWYTTYRS